MIVIAVVNKRHRQRGLYIGRPTIFGNYAEGDAETLSSRHKHVEAYREYFHQRLETDAEFQDAMDFLITKAVRDNGLVLQCWCHPLACHGHVLRDYLVNRLNEMGFDAVAQKE